MLGEEKSIVNRKIFLPNPSKQKKFIFFNNMATVSSPNFLPFSRLPQQFPVDIFKLPHSFSYKRLSFIFFFFREGFFFTLSNLFTHNANLLLLLRTKHAQPFRRWLFSILGRRRKHFLLPLIHHLVFDRFSLDVTTTISPTPTRF